MIWKVIICPWSNPFLLINKHAHDQQRGFYFKYRSQFEFFLMSPDGNKPSFSMYIHNKQGKLGRFLTLYWNQAGSWRSVLEPEACEAWLEPPPVLVLAWEKRTLYTSWQMINYGTLKIGELWPTSALIPAHNSNQTIITRKLPWY